MATFIVDDNNNTILQIVVTCLAAERTCRQAFRETVFYQLTSSQLLGG